MERGSHIRNWERIQSLFEEAVDRSRDEQAAFLEAACPDEPELRCEIESLLDAHRHAGPFLADPVVGTLGGSLLDAIVEGSLIGPWRVLRRLGRGGMGVVYLAERSDGEYERIVALKVIKRGMDSDAILGRFLRERQILAGLEHPGIARFLDGGVTEDGRPFFVMERVEGLPLIRYCTTHGLGLEARLRLLADVCRAVQYAHNNLVVHRDLKPSNILVTTDGEAKLLDFGIARVIGGDGGADTTMTHDGLQPVTPEYAAPEQLAGGTITTATDVYSLGVILHELVTGRTPLRLGDATATRQIGPQLRRDLDTIIQTALREDPARRYATAEALQDDLRRYLTGHPISARPDTAAYRASRFLHRHKVGAFVALLVVWILTGTGVALVVQQQRTERERDRATLEAAKAARVAEFLAGIFEVSDPSISGGDDVTARQLLETAVSRLESELHDQPEMLADMAAVIGDVYVRLGEFDAALPLLERTAALRTDLHGPGAPLTARALVQLGDLHLKRTDLAPADSLLSRAIDILEGAPTEFRMDHAIALETLGRIRWRNGDLSAADSLVKAALALKLEIGDVDSAQVAASLASLGTIDAARGDLGAAESHYRKALSLYEARLGSEHRITLSTRTSLAVMLHPAGKSDEAEQHYREVLEAEERIYSGRHPDLARTMYSLARLLRDAGRFAEAEELFNRALAMYSDVLGSDHAQIASALTNLGLLQARTGRQEEALSTLDEALAMRVRLFGAEHSAVATARNDRALVLRDLGRYQDALEELLEVERIYRARLEPQHWWIAVAQVNLASIYLFMGDLAAADVLFRQGQEGLEETFAGGHPRVAGPLVGRGELALLSGRAGEAENLVREGLRVLESTLERTHWQIAEAESILGASLSAQGGREEAERLLSRSLEHLTSTLGERSVHTQRARQRLLEHRARL